MNRRPIQKRCGGFTLVELLVAITVLAIVAVLGWRGLDSIVRARVALNADLAETRGLQLAFAQMQSDCGHIVDSNDIGRRPTLAADVGRLTLVRTVFAENQPSRVQVVTYRLRDGVLARRESLATRDLRQLDNDWNAAINENEIGPAVTMQSDVEQMPIRSWTVDNGWQPGAAAATATTVTVPSGAATTPGAAPPPAAVKMPTGLEVTLQVNGRSMVKVFLLGAA